MNYELFGSGQKTIVFLHGWGGSVDSFIEYAKVFSKNYKVLVVDFAGFGKSAPPKIAYSVSDYATELKELLVKLNIMSCYIIAHSFGGRVAIKLNLIYTGIEKLVLVDSAGIKPKFSIYKWWKIRKYKIYKWLFERKIVSGKKLQKFGSKDYKQLCPIMKQTFVKIVNEDLSNCARNIACETLIVWGEKDTETPLYMAKKLNKLIAKSELIVFENCGHFCYLNKAMLFIEIVNIFLGE